MCHSMSYFTNKLLLKYALIFLPEALELFCNLLSIFRPKKTPQQLENNILAGYFHLAYAALAAQSGCCT